MKNMHTLFKISIVIFYSVFSLCNFTYADDLVGQNTLINGVIPGGSSPDILLQNSNQNQSEIETRQAVNDFLNNYYTENQGTGSTEFVFDMIESAEVDGYAISFTYFENESGIYRVQAEMITESAVTVVTLDSSGEISVMVTYGGLDLLGSSASMEGDGEEGIADDIRPRILSRKEIAGFIEDMTSEEVIDEIAEAVAYLADKQKEQAASLEDVKEKYVEFLNKYDAYDSGDAQVSDSDLSAVIEKTELYISLVRSGEAQGTADQREAILEEYAKLTEATKPVIERCVSELRDVGGVIDALNKGFKTSESKVFVKKIGEKIEVVIHLKKGKMRASSGLNKK